MIAISLAYFLKKIQLGKQVDDNLGSIGVPLFHSSQGFTTVFTLLLQTRFCKRQ